jgi:hypothetical protein
MYEKHRGLAKIRIIHIVSGKSHYIDFPQPIGHLQPGTNLVRIYPFPVRCVKASSNQSACVVSTFRISNL